MNYSGATEKFKFVLTGSTVTFHVNDILGGTGGSPTHVSTTGYSNGGSSVTVTAGDTIYYYEANANRGQFVFDGNWVTGTGGGSSGGGSSSTTSKKVFCNFW